MQELKKQLDALLGQLPDAARIREALSALVSVYPFNEYEYIISHLLGKDVLTLDQYLELRDDYTPLYVKALAFDSGRPFWMNFQQVKCGCCDVLVFISVWRDVIKYWVFSSDEAGCHLDTRRASTEVMWVRASFT